MKRADDFYDMITNWEQDKRTEKEIVNKFIELLCEKKDDIDLYYDINDALHWKGYSYQFAIPEVEAIEWDSTEYGDLVANVTKSKDKTATVFFIKIISLL